MLASALAYRSLSVFWAELILVGLATAAAAEAAAGLATAAVLGAAAEAPPVMGFAIEAGATGSGSF